MKLEKRSLVLGVLALLLVASGVWTYRVYEHRSSASSSFAWDSTASDESILKPYIHVGFDASSTMDAWRVRHFEGQSSARITPDESGHFMIDTQSRGSCSLFLTAVDVPMTAMPHVSWSWRVSKFPTGRPLTNFGYKKDSDFGARFYVVFQGLTDFTSDTIQYVWDDYFPEGTNRAMPFFTHIKVLVIRSGPSDEGMWVPETRNVVSDYEMLFGKPPTSPIQAIGFMSDSDNTGTSSGAQFKDIRIQIPKDVDVGRLPAATKPSLMSRIRSAFPFPRDLSWIPNPIKAFNESPVRSAVSKAWRTAVERLPVIGKRQTPAAV